MPGLGLPLGIHRRSKNLLLWLWVVLCAGLGTIPAGARNPNLAKYPLRVHVLAADETHRTPRMSPGQAVVCDSIQGMLDSIGPNPGGQIALTSYSGDPCLLHPEIVAGALLDIQDYDPVFSGEGRADLISPPTTTQGFNFHYDNCSRVRVHPGFQSLPARWKKPGKTLEVLIPSDDIPVNGRPLAPVRCSFRVTMHDYIYLLLRSGKLIQVSQEVYQERPALRDFLSGGTEAMQQRPVTHTVSIHPNQ